MKHVTVYITTSANNTSGGATFINVVDYESTR